MDRETLLTAVMVLFLLILFLVVVLSEAVGAIGPLLESTIIAQ